MNCEQNKTAVCLRIIEAHHEKTSFCICKNKDVDQLHGNSATDQCHYISFIDTCSSIPLLPKPEIESSTCTCITICCGCKARFVFDLVGGPKDRFSHDTAQIWHTMMLCNMEKFIYISEIHVHACFFAFSL